MKAAAFFTGLERWDREMYLTSLESEGSPRCSL